MRRRWHIDAKVPGDRESGARDEDSPQSSSRLLRPIIAAVRNAPRLFSRKRASRSLTKTGLWKSGVQIKESLKKQGTEHQDIPAKARYRSKP